MKNILKRISYFCNEALPTGETWHLELLERFCQPSFGSLPELLDKKLYETLSVCRRFRHVVHHGYTIRLNWERMSDGVGRAQSVYAAFKTQVQAYLQKLKA